MSLLDKLSMEEIWNSFYEYRTSLVCPKDFAEELRAFIDGKEYLPVCGSIARGDRFPLPRKAVISKMSSKKKRTVYIYPRGENMVLKLLTHLLLRRYDPIFAKNLFSFRPNHSAKDAIRTLRSIPGIRSMYAYKADISNYFNSIPIGMLLPDLEAVTGGDPRLCDFLSSLLAEKEVLDRGRAVEEEKGIMAGTPLASFYANLYLKELDARFESDGIPYARYSDDIILFAENEEELDRRAGIVREFLRGRGLSINPDKEQLFSPDEGWVFLGFRYRNGTVDIAPASVEKLKKKMRRKARALKRWQERNGHPGEKAAAAFIRVFNRKLLENSNDSDLTWSFWFFSVINTADSLREIDRYAQECVRYLVSGTRTKARYNVRYEELKKLGYRSLVHEYYSFGSGPSV